MPLVKKDGSGLGNHGRPGSISTASDEKDSIGKRYRRQELPSVLRIITIDHQTLEDNCVTLRNDTMEQERVAIADLNRHTSDKVSITSLLKTLQ